MMPGGGSEIPEDRFIILGEQRKPVGLVLRPGANVGRGDVADVVHIETEQRSHRGLLQQISGFLQALAAEPIEVDAALPIDRHASMSFDCHKDSLALSSEQLIDSWVTAWLSCYLPHILLAAANTVSSVGTVTSSSGGENGIGTCIAPMRFTGASRS